MSGKLVLKKDRGKYRFFIYDDKDKVVFNSPFLGEKDKALTFADVIVKADNFADHMSCVQGNVGSPAAGAAGKKWVIRADIRLQREGERGCWDDGTPLGFSAEQFDSEADAEKAKAVIAKAAKGAKIVDET